MTVKAPASNSSIVVFFRDTLGCTREYLMLAAFLWSCIVFLIAAPLVSWHVDDFLTRLCNKMAVSWTAAIIFSVAVVIWALQLWVNYAKAHATRFELEYQLDADEARLGPQPWVAQFRSAYRRREFLSVFGETMFASCILVYYQIWVAFTFIIRLNVHPYKAACGNAPVTFRFLEKIYLQQFVKDLPFSTGDLVDLYGKCAPDTEVYAVKVLTSLASALHWFLILFLVGFLWRKQIKTWLFPEKREPEKREPDKREPEKPEASST